MPWIKEDYLPSYKNQPEQIREKAVEIANEILKESGDEGLAIATGLSRAVSILRIILTKRRRISF